MSEPTTKPRVEVTQESAERLETLELERTPRPEKKAREAALLEGASEVRYAERQFRPRHPEALDDVRRKVDDLRVPERRALPDAPPLPPPPAPVVVPRPVSDEHQAALAPVVQGKLLQVDSLYRTETGEVVEAKWESPDGARTQSFVLEGGQARPVDEVDRRVDALPTPKAPAAPPTAPEPTAAPEPAKKRKLGLPSLGRKKPDAPAEQATEPAAEDEPRKRRFGFGKR